MPSARLSAAERRAGIIRENSLAFAMQTAMCGEDPMAVIARAQLYEEYMLAREARAPFKWAGLGIHFDAD